MDFLNPLRSSSIKIDVGREGITVRIRSMWRPFQASFPIPIVACLMIIGNLTTVPPAMGEESGAESVPEPQVHENHGYDIRGDDNNNSEKEVAVSPLIFYQ
jgi:hypothetical protein